MPKAHEHNSTSSSRGCLYLCMCLTRWIPVVFIAALLGWSYYAYAIELCFNQIQNWVQRAFYFVCYHIVLVLFAWSYYQTIFTPVKRPPDEFYLLETDVYQMASAASEPDAKAVLERRGKDLPILTRTNSGAVRYCDKCKCIKPDRSHHCSVCQACVLKMDHHCPWVNNCVGYANYKFFILFLGYSTLYCLYIAATSLEYFIKFWADLQNIKANRFHILFLFFVSIMFAISISSLFFYHIYLTARNCTTLESFRPPIFASTMMSDKHGFNLGRKENFKQVFGPSLLKAFLPIFTSTVDGVSFPTSLRQTIAASSSSNTSHNSLPSSPGGRQTSNGMTILSTLPGNSDPRAATSDRSYLTNEQADTMLSNRLADYQTTHHPLTKQMAD